MNNTRGGLGEIKVSWASVLRNTHNHPSIMAAVAPAVAGRGGHPRLPEAAALDRDADEAEGHPEPEVLRNYFELERRLCSVHGRGSVVIVTYFNGDGDAIHMMYGWVIDANGQWGTLGAAAQALRGNIAVGKLEMEGYDDLYRGRILEGRLADARAELMRIGWTTVQEVDQDKLQDMYSEKDINAPLC